MQRAFAWLSGLIGIAALARYLRRRKAPAERPDSAAELRRTLERVREGEGEREGEAEEGTAPAEEPASLEERRARIHEKAQAALDEMREPPHGA